MPQGNKSVPSDFHRGEVVYTKNGDYWIAVRDYVSGGEFSTKERALADLEETERFIRIANKGK